MTAPARSSTTPSTSASMTLNDANYTHDNDDNNDDNNNNNNNSNNSTGQKQRLTRTVSLSINTDREIDKHRGTDISRDIGNDSGRDREVSNNINSNNNSNNDSNNNSNMIELSIRPLSTYAVQAMNEVTDRFYSDSCEVQGLLESALGADPSNFKKVKRVCYVISI